MRHLGRRVVPGQARLPEVVAEALLLTQQSLPFAVQ
jgi:hypothetical protein